MPSTPLPWHIEPAPDPVDPEFEPLLNEPFASAWTADPAAGAPERVRSHLIERLAASRAASARMVTARRHQQAGIERAPGVRERTLYTAAGGQVSRPGEPQRVRLIEFDPGSTWQVGDLPNHCEWLVLQGEVHIGDLPLGLRDYHVMPTGSARRTVVTSETGAWLFLREAPIPAEPGDQISTVRDEVAGWPEFAPGIRRRVLWQRDGQAALLYHAQPGASVPQHTHGHDEECLMVQGDLFLDDLLLQQGDYQLAPAGTGHRITQTDTGVVIYAHGDLDLQWVG